MRTHDRPVVVLETTPATEWILGGPVQKVSPKYTHGALQAFLSMRLWTWADGRGRVASEWRVWVTPPGERSRYLVPDVAYISYDRLPRDDREIAEEPHVAPDLAIEILSPSERKDHIAHKIDVYLRSGTAVVMIVDPLSRTIHVHDRNGAATLTESETFRHPAFPDFGLPVAEVFAALDR